MVTAEATVLDQFNERGYTVIRGLLDLEQDIQPVLDEYDVVVDGLLDRLHREGVVESTYSDLPFLERTVRLIAATGSAYYNHFQIRLPYEVVTEDTPIHLGPAVFNLLRSPRLLDGIETFIGPEISCNPVNVVRLKPPRRLLTADRNHAGIADVPWHQDIVNYPEAAEDTELLTVWVALTDATEEMGCLRLIPGSHFGELETHCSANPNDSVLRNVAGGGIPDELIDDDQAVPVPMAAGDVIFMHRFTKHSALPNRSDRLRWSFDLRYHPTHQFSGQPLRPSWVARSRAHPETEVTDHRVWAQMWNDTQAYLTRTGEIPAYVRYDHENPICAPS